MRRWRWCAWLVLAMGPEASLALSETAGYVDPAVCASCHPSVWRNYRRTGMGRSFYRPTPQNQIEDYSNRNTYYHQPSDTYFQMIRRGDRYFQLGYQIGFDGKRTNELEKEVDFIVGSGNHSRTYLHRTNRNTLIELPLAWYAERGGYWAMNPGYDRPDHQGFRRVIGYDCLFCHNAYPEIPGSAAPADPVFSKLPEGIDCQRCHGPGEQHVRAATTAGTRSEDIRAPIINPARLAPERQMEVCLQCHLETTSFPLPNSIVRFERTPFSYRPGEPLGDFRLHFDKAGDDDRFEIAGAAYRLRKSECFEKSGTLQCTTCHDPHTAGSTPAQHYIAVCRQCHNTAFNSLVAAGKHTQSTDCTGCHMPKRRTDDVVHAVMTDHYIQRRNPARDLLAPLAERPADANPYRGPVDLYYPKSLSKPEDELYLAVAQVRQGSNLAEGISRLSAALETFQPERGEYYLQLANALRDSGQLNRAAPMYDETLRRQPRDPASVQNLALCLISMRQQARAADALRQAVAAMPDDAGTWQLLGTVLAEGGKSADAIAAFQKAAVLDPDLPEAHNSLGGLWLQARDLSRAEPALREAIRLRPLYWEAHNNLANLLASTDRFEEARYHFELALRAKTENASVRFDFAIALARTRRMAEAQQQLETALSQSPNWAEAHELLGTVLASQGRAALAIEQYREALRIRPQFSRAQLHLGEALADGGNVAAALPYLRQAAAASDPTTRDEARRELEKLKYSRPRTGPTKPTA